ncbi:MAG: prepilin-type N-terminal cleavage/methylation domain-containing protein [Gemmatimonadota bacterium]
MSGSPRQRRPSRTGFTLVELIIATALGALLLLTIYQVVLVGQRTFSRQAARLSVQQTARAATDVLTALLRETSAQAGDFLGMGPDSLRLRRPITFAVACDVSAAPSVVFEPYARWVAQGDSVMVWAENDPANPADDVWLIGVAGPVDTTAGCPSGGAGERVELNGLVPPLGANVLSVGAPVRAFQVESYGLRPALGAHYLARWVGLAEPVPLVGPLGPPGQGLQLTFLDRLGNVVANPASVAQIELLVRTFSPVLDSDGAPIADSLSTRVSLRN